MWYLPRGVKITIKSLQSIPINVKCVFEFKLAVYDSGRFFKVQNGNALLPSKYLSKRMIVERIRPLYSNLYDAFHTRFVERWGTTHIAFVKLISFLYSVNCIFYYS